MKFELLGFDNAHYASNILQVDTLLKWDSLGDTHHLIIRGEFGANIQFTVEEKALMERHANEQIFSGKEIRYASDRYFAFQKKGYVNNYTITSRPAKYAVFCCVYDPAADTCKLYVPNDACQYQCDVSAGIEVQIKRRVVKQGFLGRLTGRQVEGDSFLVEIPGIPGYTDGSLQYTFDGCNYRYPITKAMLGKAVSIPAFQSKPPRIESASGNGYKIIVHGGN